MWLKIISLKHYLSPESVAPLLAETEELVKIFHTSVSTARKALSPSSPP